MTKQLVFEETLLLLLLKQQQLLGHRMEWGCRDESNSRGKRTGPHEQANGYQVQMGRQQAVQVNYINSRD